MRTLKMFLALMMVCFFVAQVKAQGNSQNQNGNAVLSQVDFYDNGDGTATLKMKISGNLSGTVEVVTFSVSGDVIPGGTYSSFIDQSRLLIPNPTFLATVPIQAIANTGHGNQVQFVDVDVAWQATNGPQVQYRKRLRAVPHTESSIQP
ncbi:MAG: hypothetical protein IPN95_21830 [Bacteroidetes bacterium]|nr:hypothetical protein [Bacteroidota bacterium]